MTNDPQEQLRTEFNEWARAGKGEGMEKGHGPAGKQAIQLMRVPSSARVLDVGCGSGWATRLLAEHASSGQVTGIDHFRIVVTTTGAVSKPALLFPPTPPVSIPPRSTFAIAIDPSHRGAVAVTVDALNAAGDLLATATGPGTVVPSQQTTIALLFRGTHDLGGAPAEMGGNCFSSPTRTNFAPARFTMANRRLNLSVSSIPASSTTRIVLRLSGLTSLRSFDHWFRRRSIVCDGMPDDCVRLSAAWPE